MSLESSDGQEGSAHNHHDPGKPSPARSDGTAEKTNGSVTGGDPSDRLHSGTPHPGPLPFGRGEGEPSSSSGVVHVANYSRKGHAPRSVEFEAVEPWPEPVDGKELLDCLVTELQRFVVFSKWIAETFALWILHTYAFRLREVRAYIGMESPQKASGK